MKRVIILQGVSGSGKSTFARNIAGKLYPGYENIVIVSADDYFTIDRVYMFNPAHLSQAHAQCFRQFLIALQSDKPTCVIVDNTNTRQIENCTVHSWCTCAVCRGPRNRVSTLQHVDRDAT